MKKFTTIVAVLMAAYSHGQDLNLNLGGNINSAQIEIEKEEQSFYYKAQAEYNFDEQYSNVGFGFGYRTNLDRFDVYRFYIGGKIGLISHTNQNIAGNATFGAETSVSVRISDNISIRPKYVMDWREDLKFYGVNYKPSFKGSVFLSLSISLN